MNLELQMIALAYGELDEETKIQTAGEVFSDPILEEYFFEIVNLKDQLAKQQIEAIPSDDSIQYILDFSKNYQESAYSL